MTKNKPREPQNHFVGKREHTPPLQKSAAVPTTLGQRYAKTSWQMPTNKYNKTGK